MKSLSTLLAILLVVLKSTLSGQITFRLDNAYVSDSIRSIDIQRGVIQHESAVMQSTSLNAKNNWEGSIPGVDYDLYNVKISLIDREFTSALWMSGELVELGFDEKSNHLFTIDSTEAQRNFEEASRKLTATGVLGFDVFYYQSMLLIDELKDNVASLHLVEYVINAFPNDLDRQLSAYSLVKDQSSDVKALAKGFSMHNYFDRLRKSIREVPEDTWSDIELDVDSTTFSLDWLIPEESKYTVIDFWFIGCPPCLKDHLAMRNDRIKLDINIVGLTDEYPEDIREYRKKHLIDWPNMTMPEMDVGENFGVLSYPTYWIINDKGEIVFRANTWDAVKIALSGLRLLEN